MEELGIDLKYHFYVLIRDEIRGPCWVLVNWDQVFDISKWKLGDYMIAKQDGVRVSARKLLQNFGAGLGGN